MKHIEASNGQVHIVDMSTEFMDIMARNIITVAFGEDINDELFELKVRKSPESSEFES